MKAASFATKWSDGKIATVAWGSRHAIQWAGSRMPAAVPRSSDCTRTLPTFAAPGPENSEAKNGAWASVVTTTVRSGRTASAVRSSVRRRSEREPTRTANCLGRPSA